MPAAVLSTSPGVVAPPPAAKAEEPSVAQRLRKTEMCRYFATGCRNGAKCVFAHEKAELRRRPDFTKTTLCPEWAKGFCGKPSHLCQFAHGKDELRRRSGKRKAAAPKPGADALAPISESDRAAEEERPSMTSSCGRSTIPERERPSLKLERVSFSSQCGGLWDQDSAPTSPGSCRFSWNSSPHDDESDRLSPPSCRPSWAAERLSPPSCRPSFAERASSQRSSWADVIDEEAESALDPWEFGGQGDADDLLTPLPASGRASRPRASQPGHNAGAKTVQGRFAAPAGGLALAAGAGLSSKPLTLFDLVMPAAATAKSPDARPEAPGGLTLGGDLGPGWSPEQMVLLKLVLPAARIADRAGVSEMLKQHAPDRYTE